MSEGEKRSKHNGWHAEMDVNRESNEDDNAETINVADCVGASVLVLTAEYAFAMRRSPLRLRREQRASAGKERRRERLEIIKYNPIRQSEWNEIDFSFLFR